MWQQLKIQARSEDSAALEQLLLDQGALAITYLDAEDQAVFQKEPGSTPLWDNTWLISLFEADQNLSGLLFLLGKHVGVANAASLQIELLEDQAWERSWMDEFHPMQFGDKLWICPSWQTPPDPAAVTIMLDPGLAFGSGSHATTAMCLRWLEQTDLDACCVIDYGCGSGVLAIGAALLGASTVIAVDNDPQAITATLDNSQRNQIPSGLIQALLPEQLPAQQADVLLANILAEPLLELAPRFAQLTRSGGSLVLSGLLEEQVEPLQQRYQAWFDMEPPLLEQGWARLSGVRKA